MKNIILPLNKFHLTRFPVTKNNSLKAWNAADEYLLEYLNESRLNTGDKVLIVNDQFGALCCCLSHYDLHYWSDSFLSVQAIQSNLENNNLNSPALHIEQCVQHIPKDIKYDWVVIRIPKHNSLLKYQLETIRQHLHSNTIIISAGMTKEIHKSNLNLFESIIGPTSTSLAKKKARLIHPKVKSLNNKSKTKNTSGNEYTNKEILETSTCSFHLKKYNLTIIGLPGVFSRNSLDIGSQVLLKSMPETKPGQKLIDLGCGTGVLGTYAAKKNSKLEVTFTDESWLAIRSAHKTFHQNNKGKAIFSVTNVLDGLKNEQYDFVLCNPPFHQQNVQTLAIANKMFKESALKLNTNGELRVVANRHLKYRPNLNRYFKNVDIISKDPKFIVWRATMPKSVKPK